ncbi:MAG: endonuclease [Magnetococcales bacterium]|nr:endonuclease [Magnetococcales bacterium]
MMVGAILVQNTAWTGASRGVAQLERAGYLSPEAIRDLPEEVLWELIRSAGYFRLKTKRLKALCGFLAGYGDDLSRLFRVETGALREELLGVYGVGPETADSILLYAAGRPLFLVDAYTRRIFGRLGWVEQAEAPYEILRGWVEERFPVDVGMLNEFHALIVRLGKEHCRAKPLCSGCPITSCPYPRKQEPSPS